MGASGWQASCCWSYRAPPLLASLGRRTSRFVCLAHLTFVHSSQSCNHTPHETTTALMRDAIHNSLAALQSVERCIACTGSPRVTLANTGAGR